MKILILTLLALPQLALAEPSRHPSWFDGISQVRTGDVIQFDSNAVLARFNTSPMSYFQILIERSFGRGTGGCTLTGKGGNPTKDRFAVGGDLKWTVTQSFRQDDDEARIHLQVINLITSNMEVTSLELSCDQSLSRSELDAHGVHLR